MASLELILDRLRAQGVPEEHFDSVVQKLLENIDANPVAGGASKNDEGRDPDKPKSKGRKDVSQGSRHSARLAGTVPQGSIEMGKAKGKERENEKVPAKRTSAGDESGRKKRKTLAISPGEMPLPPPQHHVSSSTRQSGSLQSSMSPPQLLPDNDFVLEALVAGLRDGIVQKLTESVQSISREMSAHSRTLMRLETKCEKIMDGATTVLDRVNAHRNASGTPDPDEEE